MVRMAELVDVLKVNKLDIPVMFTIMPSRLKAHHMLIKQCFENAGSSHPRPLRTDRSGPPMSSFQDDALFRDGV